MSDINFLDNQQHGQDQKPKAKDDKKDQLVWSNPEKEIKGPKSSAFSFLPFINKPAPINKNSVSPINKNKLKQSRKEILNLIKHHENSKPPLKEKGKNFLRTLGEKLKKQPAAKQALIDYQQVFNQAKEHKNQADRIFNIKPTFEDKIEKKPSLIPALKGARGELNWFNRLSESLKRKIIALTVRKNETAKIIKLPKVEEIKPAPVQPLAQLEKSLVEVKEIKIAETAPIHKNEIRQRVLDTNLIRGELVTFFDWRAKIIAFAAAILAPIFVAGAVYYGLVFYQKSSQAKNSAQAQKFAELEQDIIKEEFGLKEIFAFQASLKIVSQIFEQHVYWTNFFKFLEDNMIKDVYFTGFDGDTSGSYSMNAVAADYSNIAEQVKVFRNNNKVTAVLTGGGALAAGDNANKSLVKFILNFSVLKNIFTE